jgi:hypothetical protein
MKMNISNNLDVFRLDVTIESFTLDNLPKEIFNWAFQLVKKNMREM